MRIGICVKYELDTSGPFSLTEATDQLDTRGLVSILNPADLSSVVLMRSAMPEAEITVLTVGAEETEPILRECLSQGADAAVRIWDDALAKTSPDARELAELLAAATRHFGFDLVVCGAEGLSDSSGSVGPTLAELLDFVQVNSIDYLETSPDSERIQVHRKQEHGDRQVVSCTLPAVLTVEAGAANIPYVSWTSMLTAAEASLQVLTPADVGFTGGQGRSSSWNGSVHYTPPKPRVKKTSVAEQELTPQQRMQQMIGLGAAKQSSDILEGNPKEAAAELIKQLEERKLL